MRIDKKRIKRIGSTLGGFGDKIVTTGKKLSRSMDRYAREAPARRAARIKELEFQIREEGLKQKLKKMRGEDKKGDSNWL
jgi:hypothetical protein